MDFPYRDDPVIVVILIGAVTDTDVLFPNWPLPPFPHAYKFPFESITKVVVALLDMYDMVLPASIVVALGAFIYCI